ncbi:NAD-dependent epimerase/dehydratase family protein [Desertimonas flava]|uniref:NAD-dependent epimerase/dehydratase family protein n=1 Tax=Desertimonas flava TaxID=2064846 RepID=UPI0013C52B49|nr:NAD-dependent epimerase/dehydratase family protein [Desertimonas flava]
MSSLVLGGSVFVGRRLVDALLAAGEEVAVLNRGRTGTDLPPEVQRIVADRTDPDSMRAPLAGRAWDAVYDVSGFVMVAGGGDIDGLLDLVDGTTESYVYVSSIMAYDQSLVGIVPWTEDLPTDDSGPRTYGGFKAVAERAMLTRHERTGFPITIVRPAAIYGPRNNIFDMETPMFLRLVQGRPILLPHGGLVTASYGHVDDLCHSMIGLAAVEAARGEIVNVTAEAVTTRRYVDTLAAVVGAQPDIVDVPDAALDGLPPGLYGHLFDRRHHAVLGTARLDRLLGPGTHRDLRTGHADTYEWFLAQGWAELDGPLSDPVWRATWDFDAEAAAAATLR